MSKTAAFYLQASITILFIAGAVAPTPLYALYQARWGFSPITVTVIYGAYALAVLASLLVTGRLSDHLGRKPVLFAATLVHAATMGLFMAADGVGMLLVARILQGLATGTAVAAVGAGLLDLDVRRGPIANALAPVLGTAAGSLGAGLVVQFLPAPMLTIYALYGAVFLGQAIATRFMPETVAPRAGAWGSLKPRFALPERIRRPMLVATPAIVAAWSLAGFYGSIGSMVVKRLVGSTAPVLGGLGLFVIAIAAAALVFATTTRSPREVMTLGTASLVVGVGTTLLAIPLGSVPVFLLGALVAGIGFGGSFQGAVRSVVSLARPEERAGVLSILFVVAYLAMGLPAVLGGVRMVMGGGVYGTAFEYGVAVMALAAIALLGTLASSPEAKACVQATLPSTR